MKRTTKKCVKKTPSMVVGRDDEASLSAYFAEQDQLLLPMLELIDSGKQTIAAVMNEAGRAIAELLLELSAQQIAGAKHPGRHASEVRWHGSQDGQICLLGAQAQGEAAAASQAGARWRFRSMNGCETIPTSPGA